MKCETSKPIMPPLSEPKETTNNAFFWLLGKGHEKKIMNINWRTLNSNLDNIERNSEHNFLVFFYVSQQPRGEIEEL